MSERTKKADEATDDPAPADAVPAEPVVHYIAPLAQPATEEATEQPAESLDIPDGHAAVVYRGNAHVVRHGDFEFRSGIPVVVPDDIAEDLLTLPHEKFEAISKE